MNDLKEKSTLETESSSVRSHSPKNSFGRDYRPVVRQCGGGDDDDNDNDEYPKMMITMNTHGENRIRITLSH